VAATMQPMGEEAAEVLLSVQGMLKELVGEIKVSGGPILVLAGCNQECSKGAGRWAAAEQAGRWTGTSPGSQRGHQHRQPGHTADIQGSMCWRDSVGLQEPHNYPCSHMAVRGARLASGA
jgi:hypothetical protein